MAEMSQSSAIGVRLPSVAHLYLSSLDVWL